MYFLRRGADVGTADGASEVLYGTNHDLSIPFFKTQLLVALLDSFSISILMLLFFLLLLLSIIMLHTVDSFNSFDGNVTTPAAVKIASIMMEENERGNDCSRFSIFRFRLIQKTRDSMVYR
jgi:hypothetical protein